MLMPMTAGASIINALEMTDMLQCLKYQQQDTYHGWVILGKLSRVDCALAGFVHENGVWELSMLLRCDVKPASGRCARCCRDGCCRLRGRCAGAPSLSTLPPPRAEIRPLAAPGTGLQDSGTFETDGRLTGGID
jgi:hypothetical protein